MKVRTFSLGAGADVVNFDTITTSADKNSITGFTTGTDKLHFDATTFTGASGYSSSSGYTDLTSSTVLAKGKIYKATESVIKGTLSGAQTAAGKYIFIATDTGDIYAANIVTGTSQTAIADTNIIGTVGSSVTLAAGDFIVE